jgi:hypothetical protein
VAEDKIERQRRHPLQVTAARIRDALKDYPQAFDAPSRAVAEVLARRMDDAVDGILEQPAVTPNPGQPYDQRQDREPAGGITTMGLSSAMRASK